MDQKITLKVSGMTCGHCQRAVNEEINDVAGVQACEVDLKNGQAAVTFDKNTTTAEAIIAAVNCTEVYHAENIAL